MKEVTPINKVVLNIFVVLCVCILGFLFVACGGGEKADPDKGGKISAGAMNGPTMIGLGKLDADGNANYTLKKESTPDAIVAGLANKTFDSACLPANNAAILFNNGSVGVQVAAINTLNVLYLVQKASAPAVSSLKDLVGKTVYMPGQGSTPEFAFRYLIEKAGIKKNDVSFEFETEGSIIAAGLKIKDSKYEYAVLPQPAATVAMLGDGAAKEVLNLSDEWKKYNPGYDIVTGVLVVRTAFLKNNKSAFDKFLEDYKRSAEFMADAENLDTAAGFVVDMKIVPKMPIAKAALPKCGVTFIEKEMMKSMLADFYGVLYLQNKETIGGKVPTEEFYYL